MKRLLLLAAICVTSITLSRAADASEDGFVSLFNGRNLDGWKKANENETAFNVVDGSIVAHGNRCHLYYVGESRPFRNFELKVEVMTEPNSNGGIYFHTKYQETGWPKYGFESQVNVTHGDWIKTGSLYGLVNVAQTPAKDRQWWTQHIIVKGNQVTVKVDGQTVLQYTEPDGAQPGKDFTRKLDEGTFALQAHDPKSIVRFRNLRVKRLD